MSINIINGKSRVGKTTYIYNKIKENYDFNTNNNIKSFVIVPEQFGLTAEENLCSFLGKNGLLGIEVLTFKRMSYKVFNELGINIKHISDVGKKVLIYNILKKNQYAIFNSNNKGTIESILDIFSEFDRYNIDVEQVKEIKYDNSYLEKKMNDLINIYEKYTEKLSDNLFDSNNDLDVLYNNIQKSNLLKNCNIYIDEFYGFTNQEYDIICELANYNNIYITFCVDDEKVSDNPLDIYNINKQAYSKFIRLCAEKGLKIDNQVTLQKDNEIDKTDNTLKHLQNNIFNYPYKEYKYINENIEKDKINIYACTNQYNEIENLAQSIVKNIQAGYRYNDITVITRDVSKYSDLIWGIFTKYNIPYFLDLKKDIIDNQISTVIFSLLDIAISNFSYQSVFAYLKTGFLDIDIDDIYQLENYAIKWGIKGYKWLNSFTYGSDENNKEKVQELEKINNIREKVITPLINFKKDIEKAKISKDIVKVLYTFLSQNNIAQSIENKISEFRQKGLTEIEKEYLNLWNYYIDVFEQLTISLDNEQIDLKEFKNVLEIGLSNTQKAFIPLFKDLVLIGDIDRTRTRDTKIIYYIGMQNGTFPISFSSEGNLTDNDREFLLSNNVSLAKTTKLRTLEDEFNIYKSLTMVTDNVNFSYILNDLDGISYRPSYLISKIKKIFNLQEYIVDNEYIIKPYLYNSKVNFENIINKNENELLKWYIEYNPRLYNTYLDICRFQTNMKLQLSKQNIDTLYGDILNTSISRLEEYTKCPYSFYLKYCLKVKQRDIFSVKMIDIGNINHKVLDEFFSYVINENIDILNLTNEQTNKIASDIIEDVFDNMDNSMIKNAKNFNILKYKLKNTLLKAIWVLVLQIKNSSFRPIGTEVEFGDNKQYQKISITLDNGKKVNLTGKIDRIDIADTKDGRYIRIIDYKSSNKSIDIPDIYNGLNLQLITYLDATTQNTDIIPGGILYFKIDNPIVSTKSDIDIDKLEKEILKQLRLNGLILNDKQLIKHMDYNIDKTSDLVNIKINEDGISTNKNAVTLNDFYELQKQSKIILKKISDEIMSGKIDVMPYWKNKNMYGCRYCEYNSICKFDSKNEKCKYNIIK